MSHTFVLVTILPFVESIPILTMSPAAEDIAASAAARLVEACDTAGMGRFYPEKKARFDGWGNPKSRHGQADQSWPKRHRTR